MEQNTDQANTSSSNPISTPASSPAAKPKKRKHKLEIQVYEADYDKADAHNGQPQWRPVRSDPILDGGRPNIIEVADKNEFLEIQRQYALCDQRIKVIREIDPFVDEPVNSKSPAIPQNNQAVPVSADDAHTPDVEASCASQSTMLPLQQHTRHESAVHTRSKPKIVTIGDMQVKYDGDKVYQKQWVKLNTAEASNFRIVNDANNKIFPLTGKHIECRKWVIIEEDNDDADNDVLSGIGD